MPQQSRVARESMPGILKQRRKVKVAVRDTAEWGAWMADDLLLLPGLLCDGRLWRDQAAGLAGVARVVIADLTLDDSVDAMARRALAAMPGHFALCGLSMGAEKGTIQADDISARSKKCTSAGKPAISLKVFPDQNAVNLALATGRIDAALADSGVAGYMAKQSGGKFEIVGQPYATAPYGIAIPKNTGSFDKALQGAVDKLIQNGTYQKILKKWSATQGAITKSEINAAVS